MLSRGLVLLGCFLPIILSYPCGSLGPGDEILNGAAWSETVRASSPFFFSSSVYQLYGCEPKQLWALTDGGPTDSEGYFMSFHSTYSSGFNDPPNFPSFGKRIVNHTQTITQFPYTERFFSQKNSTLKYNSQGYISHAELLCDLITGERWTMDYTYSTDNQILKVTSYRGQGCLREDPSRRHDVLTFDYHHPEDRNPADKRRIDFLNPVMVKSESFPPPTGFPPVITANFRYFWEKYAKDINSLEEPTIRDGWPNKLIINSTVVEFPRTQVITLWFNKWGKAIKIQTDRISAFAPPTSEVLDVSFDLNNRLKKMIRNDGKLIFEAWYNGDPLGTLNKVTVGDVFDPLSNIRVIPNSITFNACKTDCKPVPALPKPKPSQVKVFPECRGTWVIQNLNYDSIKIKWSRSSNIETATEMMLSSSESKVVAHGGGKRFYVWAGDSNVQVFNGRMLDAKKCLELEPVCEKVYKVINHMKYGTNFTWISNGENGSAQGEGHVNALSSTTITTPGGARKEVTTLYLMGLTREDRKRGNRKDCPSQ